MRQTESSWRQEGNGNKETTPKVDFRSLLISSLLNSGRYKFIGDKRDSQAQTQELQGQDLYKLLWE